VSSPSITLRPGFAFALALCFLLLDGCYSGCPAGTVQVDAGCQKAPASADGDASAEVGSHERAATEADGGAQGMTAFSKPESPVSKPDSAMAQDAGTHPTPDAGESIGDASAPASMPADAGATEERTATGNTPEACTSDGTTRCASLGGGKRERCSGGHWMNTDACAAGEACVASAPDQSACMATLELCKGSGGSAVCDPMGTLYVCNADATVSHQELCASARLCQASVAQKVCLACMPQLEHKCEGKSLEVCSADGMGWDKQSDCDTEALCNATLGMCTAAVCDPGKFVCEKNVLKKCNVSGTAFEDNSRPCGADTCDAEGGECDSCQPGMKSCSGSTLMTCNADGQGSSATPCANGMKCVGAGQCVACSVDSECGSLSKDCRVGVCSNYSCTVGNAANGQQCSLASGSGVCQGGSCACVPKCDKPCGDSGCPGQPCPNKCGSRMCYHDACVDCVTSSDCSYMNDDCNAGTCSVGRCVASPQSRTCRDSQGATSVCANGRCPECVRSCSGKCGGESDGCGGTCPNPCSANQQCSAGRCLDCTPGLTGCKGNLADGTAGGCTSDQAGCFFGWTAPNVVSSARCDSSGHWTFQLCQGQCALNSGVLAYECATGGGVSQCISGGTCPVQP
jgi:hypothetical protein